MKILSAPQIKEWDQFTIAHESITSLGLMERAAHACVHWISGRYHKNKLYIFCGPGNNGGDGLAIARILHGRMYEMEVYILKTEKHSFDFDANLQQLPPQVTILSSANDFPAMDNNAVVIDALFGTGLHKPLEGIAEELADYLNQSDADVLSIDMPSGMFADKSSAGNSIVKATHTLTFQCAKLAFMMAENLPYTGTVHVLDIGLLPAYYADADTDSYSIDEIFIKTIYRRRPAWGHKYNFGHALLFAGSRTMMGAALLCAKACLRSGAGLCTLHVAAEQMPVLHTAIPEIIASDENDFSVLSHKKNTIAFGPGLEINVSNKQLLQNILQQWPGALLIDASGLSLLKSLLPLLKQRATGLTVLTPHSGEFEQLFGQCANDFERMKSALQQAVLYQCYIVLKGPHSYIACPNGEGYFNTSGNSGMATAGSGDALSGIITGLLAQQYSMKNACILGVYLHGLAGDIAAEKISKEALMASDIIDSLGAAFKQIEK